MTRARLIVATFVLSGAAGLICEVVWARQLVLVFGNTTQAVSAILTGFFGGMAIGSAFGGRIADRVSRPLRLFAILEMTVAVVVLTTPVTFKLLHEVYRSAFGMLEHNPGALTAIRLALSLIALAPATILMGATLPTLTRALARGTGEFASAFGRLYAANTIGAILGTIAAGFILIELIGLSWTLRVGAACSASAGIIGLLLDRAERSPAHAGSGTPKDVSSPPQYARLGLVVVAAFLTGFTSLGYQVLWTRLLASGTGNSTYVFSAILAVFLIGLAGGAAAFGWYRSRIADPVSFVAHGQVMLAVLVCIGMVAGISQHAAGIVGAGENFGELFGEFVAAIAIVVLPPTFVMGLTFPAIAAMAEGEWNRVGTNAGVVLAANTTGAIVGIVAVPFFLVPAIGSPLSVGLLAAINSAFAVALALYGRIHEALPRRVLLVSGTIVSLAVVGAMKTGGLFTDPAGGWIARTGTLFESREDQIASVHAGALGERRLWVTGTTMTVLTVDAKLMAVLPLMLRLKSRTALVVAFGMGTSFRSALQAGLTTDAVELVPSVPRMFHWFHDDAARVLADPRGRVIITDGRNYVELTERSYDIIITDPPPPLESAGVSVIASREYYEAARRRLAPGGVMMQWVPYGQTLSEFRAHLRTFRVAYPHVIVAEGPGGHGFFLFGSDNPLAFRPENTAAVLAMRGVVEDLSAVKDAPASDPAAWANVVPRLVRLEGEAVDRFIGSGPVITDDRPLPEYFLLRHLRKAPQMMRSEDLSSH